MIFQWFKSVFASNRRSQKRQLKKLALSITANKLTSSSIGDLSNVMTRKAMGKEVLFDFILKQDDLARIVLLHNGDKSTIRAIYDRLIIIGAGQWINGFHIATASIGYPESLKLLLGSFNGESFDYKDYSTDDSEVILVNDLCAYFGGK